MLAAVSGMSAEVWMPGEPISYWPALSLVPLVGWLWFRRENDAGKRGRVPWPYMLALCFFAGGFWLSLHPLPVTPPSNVNPGDRVLLRGCVVSAVRSAAERTQFLLRLDSESPDGKTLDGEYHAQVSVYPRRGETSPKLHFGDEVEATVRVRTPRNFRNAGSFDYDRHLRRQGVFWLASATGVENIRTVGTGCGSAALTRVHAVRDQLLGRLTTLFPGVTADDVFVRHYLAANLFGEEDGLGDEVLEDFRVAGVYHTLVISGQHVAILAFAIYALCSLLPAPRWTKFLLGVTLCWGYVLVSGYEVPAVRAAVAVSLYAVGSLAYRRSRPLNLISVIALLFLSADPGLLLDAGFQLSFIAVLLIAGIALPLQQHWFGAWPLVARSLPESRIDFRLAPGVAQARVELRLLAQTLQLACGLPLPVWMRLLAFCVWTTAWTASLLLMSVVVQLGLSPLLIELFHRTPTLGPFANLLIGPLLGILVPLAFLHTIVPTTAGAWVLTNLSCFIRDAVHWLAAVGPDPRIPGAPWWVLLLCALGAIAVFVRCEPLLARPARMPRRVSVGDKPVPAKPFGTAWTARLLRGRPGWVCTGVGSAVAWTLLFLHPFSAQTVPGYLELTMLDVGQGESLVVVSPQGRVAVVDTGGLGGYSSTSRLDTGESIVGPYLWSRGIRQIDLLVLSHFDFDHAGGAPAILRAFRPKELWIPTLPQGHELGERVLQIAQSRGISVRVKRQGDRSMVDGVEWRVLHPLAGDEVVGSSNENSLVIRLQYGVNRALLTGDIRRKEELRMIGAEAEVFGPSDVLKVAHHGSQTSTSTAWVDIVRPTVALVSAGWLNQFRHPHPNVMKRLETQGSAVWVTSRDGAISLRTNGLRWEQAWPTD